MQTKGKFYIRDNIAASQSAFWNRDAQAMTTVAKHATFFDTKADADHEIEHARFQTDLPLIVAQATRDISG